MFCLVATGCQLANVSLQCIYFTRNVRIPRNNRLIILVVVCFNAFVKLLVYKGWIKVFLLRQLADVSGRVEPDTVAERCRPPRKKVLEEVEDDDGDGHGHVEHSDADADAGQLDIVDISVVK